MPPGHKGFQPGNKLAKGGSHGGGNLTNEEREFRARLKAAVEKELQNRFDNIAKRYIDQAEVDNKVLMHLMDTSIPKAKTEIAISGIKTVRIIAPKYD